MEQLNEYQDLAWRTAEHDLSPTDALVTFVLGLSGESGEVADHVKKHIGHGHPFDRDKVVKELGDVLWYVAVTARHLGVDLADVARINIEKLRARYPDGFSTERSLNRATEER